MAKYRNTLTHRIIGALAAAAIRLLGALPRPVGRTLGAGLGQLGWRLNGRSRQVAECNIRICFPELQPSRQQQLARQSLIEIGAGAGELAWLWRHPQAALAMISAVEGDEPLRATLASGRPVIVMAPHLGCWELVNFWLAHEFDMHAMFKPSQFAAVNRLISDSRQHFASTLHPATARGVASLARALKAGPVVSGILPDQVPAPGAGRHVPFFGYPALTGTLPCKLLRQTGARAFAVAALRLPDQGGYRMLIREPAAEIYHTDLDISLTALNQAVEALVREAPEQYIWNYKRFRRQPAGAPDPYRQRAAG